MTDLETLGKNAREAAYSLVKYSESDKNRALANAAEALREHCDEILQANRRDLDNGRSSGMSQGILDRLMLNKERIDGMADAILDVTRLPDPIGEVLSEDIRPNGLKIIKKRVPIGVIGIIYEARPNVTSDAFALTFKSSNAVILKGGSDAIHSNMAIAGVLRKALKDSGFNENAIQLIEATDHETTQAFMKMHDCVDVLIPRGSRHLIEAVVKNASVPVIETGAGNCHIFLDETADVNKAVPIVFNAKTQRIGVCNACESLVADRTVLPAVLVPVIRKLQERNVTCYADPESLAVLRAATDLHQELIQPATEEDFGTEYLDYKISVKTVGSVEEAIQHINHYSTKHSESIITENPDHAARFLNEVDSACVYWNASTRFTDGGQFGFGAEIGISTAKLHARGPMGLKELTTSKYEITGNGQIRK